MSGIDTEKLQRMRGAAPLLPEPGGEVVVELLDEIDRLRAENARLRMDLVRAQQADAPEGHARIGGQVVRLEHARNHKYDYEGAYIAGTFCGWVDDEADTYGRCADGFYQPLYVAVPLDSEEADDGR